MGPTRSPLWRYGRLLLAALLTVVPAGVTAEEPAAAALSRDDLVAAAREVMDAARLCALVTIDQAGLPWARTMDPFPPDDDMVVWLGTNPRSRKVEQIRANPHVVLYYSDPERMAYVTIAGTARLVEDPEAKARRWKDEWAGFYPDREHGYLLIQVTPDRLEVFSAAHGIEGDPRTWAPPSVRFDHAAGGTRPPG